MQQYSVLMSVYKTEKAEYLRQSMESIYNQTIPTSDFVLICDGPLTQELDTVILEMQVKFGDVLHVIRLKENVGLGQALNIGVLKCKHDLIARMDSDDISEAFRCEHELLAFQEHPDVSIIGSVVGEFSSTPDIIESKRVVPEKNEAIIAFAKKRNPFNHPSVMFKKNDVLAVGNYPPIRYIQDYYLWVTMLINGYKGYNIQEPLVLMRTNQALFKRRSGKFYIKLQLDLLKFMNQNNFIHKWEYIVFAVLRSISGLLPNRLRQYIFLNILRKK